ncbi:sister chromatid cohesion protein PDS5 homolog E-like [Wolffia australiana]
MEMESSEKELEEKIMDAGNRLQKAPRSVDDLLPLLDELESLLTGVEQSPTQSMLTALNPAITGLVSKDLLENTDTNVSVSVTTCISEITRITAPEAPYDDDLMKEIFHRIVQSFRNLDDVSSNLHAKRISILETVAKVRSCVVMLDLECDSLILDMFHHFLKTIRDSHSENVVSSMETVMSLVLEESEDISPDLIALLLLNVKTANKDILPVARTLAEKVITNCAVKLKPCLMEAVESVGAPLTDYSKIIATICQESADALEHLNTAKVNENEAVETAVSGETEQVSSKAPSEAQAVAETATEPLVNNGTSQPADDSSSEKKSRRSRRSTYSTEELDAASDRSARRGRGRRSIRDEDVKSPIKRRGRGRGASRVLSERIPREEAQVEKAEQPADNAASTDSARRKRGRSSGFRGSIKRRRSEASANGNSVEKVDEDFDDLEKKPLKDLAKRLLEDGENGSGTRKVRSKIGKEIIERKPSGAIEGSEIKPQKKRGRKPKRPLEEGLERPKDDNGGDVSTLGGTGGEPAAVAVEVDKSQIVSGENSRKKRRRKPVPEEAPKTLHGIRYDESLIGVKIKVWWPDDKKFYAGIVESYNPTTMKHKVLYNDGDEENLLLKKETLKFRKGTKLGIEEKIVSTSDGTPETAQKRRSESSGRKSKSTASPSDRPREVDADGSTAGSGKRRGRRPKPLEGNSGSQPRRRGRKSGAASAVRSAGSGRRRGRRPKDTSAAEGGHTARADDIVGTDDTGGGGGAEEDPGRKRKAREEEEQTEVDSGETLASGGVEDSTKRRKK